MAEALVVFTPSGKRGRFEVGTSLLSAARSLGVDIDSVCGGRAMCSRCQVDIQEGEFAKHGVRSDAAHLTEMTAPEQRLASRKLLASGRRLSCQAKVTDEDLTVEIPKYTINHAKENH